MKYDASMLIDLFMTKKMGFQNISVSTLPNIDNFFSSESLALWPNRHIYLCEERDKIPLYTSTMTDL